MCLILIAHGLASAEKLAPFSIPMVTIIDERISLISPKYGFINAKGEIVIPPVFDGADEFSIVGLAKVTINDKLGFADKNGNLVIPAIYDQVFRFSGNGLTFVKVNGKYGVINLKGNWIHSPQWNDAMPFTYSGTRWLAAVKVGTQWGILDEQEQVGQTNFDELLFFSKHGLAPAKKIDKWGLIDASGSFVISPVFDEISWSFSDTGHVAAKLNGKWGVITKNGEVRIPFVYEHISWFLGPNDEAVATEMATQNASDQPRVIYLKASGEPLNPNRFHWGGDLNMAGTAIAKTGNQYFLVKSDGTLTELGTFTHQISETPVIGVYHRMGEDGCPLFVDSEMKTLPAWASFIKNLSAESKKMVSKYPILEGFGCFAIRSINKVP
jgi:hypothetical protein